MQIRNIATLLFVLLVWASAINAQNWVRQYPNPTISQMRDVAFNTAGLGIAVGDKGAVVLSSNWGETWLLANAPDPFQQFFRVAFAPGNNASVAYTLSNNYVFTSTDAGTSWTQVNFNAGVLGADRCLQVLSASEVVVAGTNKIFRTTDAGVNWTEILKPNGIQLHSLQFLGSQQAWLGGKNGHIYHTSDGGSSWQVQDTTQFTEQVKLCFLDASTGYAGVNRKLVKTTDGGLTWSVLQETAFGSHINDIAIIDASNVVFTQGNRTYYTHDGGTSTTQVRPTLYADVNEGAFALADGQVWVCSSYFTLVKSDNGGEDYVDQIPGNKNSLSQIEFVDANHGWAAGFDFTILRTADGGANWEDISPGMNNWQTVRGAAAVTADEFWVGGDGFMVKTTDGGANWTLLNGPSAVSGVEATSNAVFACSSSGGVYKTSDGGQTWLLTEIMNQSFLSDIQFPSDNTGYVVGFGGLVAKTTNAGANWSILPFPITDNLLSVWFLNENTGWVTVDKFSNALYQTTDGGQTWTPNTLPSSAYWRSTRFTDAMNGWAAGGSSGVGRVVRTTDGGASWEEVHMAGQFAVDFEFIETSNALSLWLCGPGGNIENGLLPIASGVLGNFVSAPLALYPNPSQGSFHISGSGPFSPNAQVEVVDLRGRVVLQCAGVPEEIGWQHPTPGLYIVCVRDENRIYMGKIAVE